MHKSHIANANWWPGMGISQGTVEHHQYRGLTVEVWRTFEDPYRPNAKWRPVRRVWHFEADGFRSRVEFEGKEGALFHACLYLDAMLDGYADYFRGPRYKLNSDEYLVDAIRDETVLELDRAALRRERLMNVTVERGYSPTEEAFAKGQLRIMDT